MATGSKFRASKMKYQSQNQLTLSGFETPFSKSLNPQNRWVKLAHQIPWDNLIEFYQSQLKNTHVGASSINPRVVLGAMILKHMCGLSDRDTVMHIQENVYMQYFLGYTSFNDAPPFDASLFVEFRKRLGQDQINAINERIVGLWIEDEKPDDPDQDGQSMVNETLPEQETTPSEPAPAGKLIMDATACPQDITYPTDLKLLNDAREKTEELIDKMYDQELHGIKPRTYREKARRDYLRVAQKKIKHKGAVRVAIRKQLNYLKRNIKTIHYLWDEDEPFPFTPQEYKYLLVVQTLYDQQLWMYKNRSHSIEDRIVSIHQPHIRPIVRGKANAQVEFGAKIQVSLMNGYAFLDELSWDPFNEGTYLQSSVEKYKERFGCYPQQVLADKIYCNRTNRAWLKSRDIELRAKPLGRPTAVKEEHVRPGERNPIEGKFGQAKTAYGMGRIMTRLKETSESTIAMIILVLNLVKMAGEAPYYLCLTMIEFSAKILNVFYGKYQHVMRRYLYQSNLEKRLITLLVKN